MTIFLFVLITILSLLFGLITYFASTGFYEATTQLVNKDVAAHIARFTSPFEDGGKINKQKADSVFYQAMVISPGAEIYFLDTGGHVIAYHGEPSEIQQKRIDLDPVREYLRSGGRKFIRSADPRDLANNKIFSAAPVIQEGDTVGFIYVILNGKDYHNVASVLYKSYAGDLLVKSLVLILLLTLFFTLLYARRLNRNFNTVTGVLNRFEAGDFNARFPENDLDGLSPVAKVFNQMADLLISNMNKHQKTALWRKDFAASISHDLRTPLAIVRGYAETLSLDGTPVTDEDRKTYLQLIVNKIGSVEHMVQQLLYFSKMESPDQLPEKQPFVFSEIVQEFIASIRPSAAQKGVSISYSDEGSLDWIEADIRLMERLVQNLFINAIGYSLPGGNVDCQLRKQGEALLFQISNTGESLPLVYEQWINGPRSSGDPVRPLASGLGLAIITQIALLHHFNFSFQRMEDKNLFILRMPVYFMRQDNDPDQDTNSAQS